jgi:hypothetical protein
VKNLYATNPTSTALGYLCLCDEKPENFHVRHDMAIMTSYKTHQYDHVSIIIKKCAEK